MSEKDFERYYRRLYLPLCMFALRLTDDADEARDAVQDAFAGAWAAVGKGLETSDFRAYIYRAVRNAAIDRLRRRTDTLPVDAAADITAETIDTSVRDARLWQAIDRLPDRCRDVFLMSKRDGLSPAEIADELGISVKTVENQMTKAFARLRAELTASGGKVFFLPFL